MKESGGRGVRSQETISGGNTEFRIQESRSRISEPFPFNLIPYPLRFRLLTTRYSLLFPKSIRLKFYHYRSMVRQEGPHYQAIHLAALGRQKDEIERSTRQWRRKSPGALRMQRVAPVLRKVAHK